MVQHHPSTLDRARGAFLRWGDKLHPRSVEQASRRRGGLQDWTRVQFEIVRFRQFRGDSGRNRLLRAERESPSQGLARDRFLPESGEPSCGLAGLRSPADTGENGVPGGLGPPGIPALMAQQAEGGNTAGSDSQDHERKQCRQKHEGARAGRSGKEAPPPHLP